MSDADVTLQQRAVVEAGLVVLGAAFPRFFHYPGHLRGRGLVLYVAADLALKFSALQWLRPWEQRRTARRDAARDQLVAELGREPTREEMFERLTARRI